ncbi:radical SAM/SPASM domain-containing protein [Mucisphaera sp.]|uniref:radical SAM/SPASM domain-containing protein n=1 Tax=Mucisphaera sp. TaxID=2913024 RepID=UPI003D1220D2
MAGLIALIPTDLHQGRLGHRRSLADPLAGRSVLEHTVRRACSIETLKAVVLVHPADQDPLALLPGKLPKPVYGFADEHNLCDPQTARLVSARKWALDAWRGGLGFMTGFDELLPPGPLLRAAQQHQAESVLLIRADWPLFDTDYARELIEMHRVSPEQMKLTMTQAPPGLGPLVLARSVLADMTEHKGNFGQVLGYNPAAPAIDPIGREITLPIPAEVRDSKHRYIYDTPRAIQRLKQIAERLGDQLHTASAQRITETQRSIDEDHSESAPDLLPQQINLELTPRRTATGPIIPQAHVDFTRPDLDTDLARRIIDQLADQEGPADISLLLGGLGDPLFHPDWQAIVQHAHDTGVFGVGIETDLLAEQQDLEALLDLPIDLVIVRMNADTAETYETVMGQPFKTVVNNIQFLINERNRRRSLDGRGDATPWIVPRLIKTPDTLRDMESFFERWVRATGYAMIQPACSGCGLMPEQSPVSMEPPKRSACRQLGERMSILSDGTVALCDQDWLGRDPLGDVKIDTLQNIWQRVAERQEKHRAGRYHELTLCGSCKEWHRP